MANLILERFSDEREAGIKCCNALCNFCSESDHIICDAIASRSGDPSYVNCLNYLPQKLAVIKISVHTPCKDCVHFKEPRFCLLISGNHCIHRAEDFFNKK